MEGEGSDGKRVGGVRRGVREGKRRGWKGEGWERGGEGGNETNWSVGDRPVTCLLTHQSINPMPKGRLSTMTCQSAHPISQLQVHLATGGGHVSIRPDLFT